MIFIEKLSPLYEAVQSSGIFPDSKFFVDCIPAYPVERILAEYALQKDAPGFDLKRFVEKQFIYPPERKTDYRSEGKPLRTHLNDLWTELQRSPDEAGGTLIPLPNAYIVPGGRFREIYYWDSYFTMLGLKASGRVDLIRNMMDNFAFLLRECGRIPNGNRTYYLSRSQPPFFALMTQLLRDAEGDEAFLKYRDALKKEYAFWTTGSMTVDADRPTSGRVVRTPDDFYLNRYWDDLDTPRPEAWIEDVETAHKAGGDPALVYRHIRAAAESGWDFSSRWFADPQRMESIRTTDILPVDLNCLLFYVEETLRDMYQIKGDDAEAAWAFDAMSKRRAAAIRRYFWDESEGFFFDYLFTEQKTTGIYALSAAFPLFFGIATPEQAAGVARTLETRFLQPGGLVSTLYTTGQQWDAPNGWAPLQWIAYKGLLRYGFNDLAGEVRARWMQNNEKVYAETGKMMEKYNVADVNVKAGGGEYPNQDGFGWTNGVYLAMAAEEQA